MTKDYMFIVKKSYHLISKFDLSPPKQVEQLLHLY